MSDETRRADMRALVVDAHAAQQRDGGRVPYAAHVLSVGEILRDALQQGGECNDAGLALDLYLVALGHDLYEDTEVTPDQIRARFGARVDTLIEGMTNRAGDDDRAAYEARMGGASEEVRLIKLADLIDNVVSCAYGIHDLGRHWIRDTFVPIASGMSTIVERATYTRFANTARLMKSWLDFAMTRLNANLAIALVLEPDAGSADHVVERLAKWDGTLGGGGSSATDALGKDKERESREGWLVKGMRAFGDNDREPKK